MPLFLVTSNDPDDVNWWIVQSADDREAALAVDTKYADDGAERPPAWYVYRQRESLSGVIACESAQDLFEDDCEEIAMTVDDTIQ